jgi:16S rRNA (uracil1498-N3)-methyltransferase
MQLYYANGIETSPVVLDKEESHHIIHVMRHRKGDMIFVTDGKGTVAKAVIAEADAKACQVELLNFEKFYSHPYKLHMAVAPTKNMDRFEWFIEKAVETGVNEITPLITHRSERRVVNRERLHKLLLSAAKQSHKPQFPLLHEITELTSFAEKNIAGKKYIAVCTEGMPLLKNIYQKGDDAMVLIGPEGDFDETETMLCFNKGFAGMSLGGYRLRTETAALAACQTIALVNQ